MFLNIKAKEAIVANFDQWEALAAHSRFYFFSKNESSSVNAWRNDKDKIALSWATEFLASIAFNCVW